jgi:S-(hydroxymethyl)glutathione dehydrogenase/alcohol dehydrogenase
MIKAAIFTEVKRPLLIEDIEVDRPLPHEVLLRTVASGVCHSDLHFMEGLYPMATPAVLGHEAAGVVESVGSLVTDFKPGDHVIACLSVFCGKCEHCITGNPARCQDKPVRPKEERPRLTWRGKPLTQMANLGAYAEEMLVHENSVVRIRKDMPLDRAALIGCGVTTGVGAALNTAAIHGGCSVAVFGTGGIGLGVIQGARIGGALQIIAVDVSETKLKTAMDLGATHVVDSSSHDPVQAIKEITGGGADYTFEAVGLKETAEACWEALKPGGTATIIGMIPVGTKIEIEGSGLRERKLQGCSMGSNRFKIDMPKYVEFYLQGRLLLDQMITRRGRLEDVNEAYRAMKAREVARSVLMFD